MEKRERDCRLWSEFPIAHDIFSMCGAGITNFGKNHNNYFDFLISK